MKFAGHLEPGTIFVDETGVTRVLKYDEVENVYYTLIFGQDGEIFKSTTPVKHIKVVKIIETHLKQI